VRKKFTWPLALAAVATTAAMVAAPAAQAAPTASTGNLTAAQSQALHDRLAALLPADAKARVAALYARLGVQQEADPQDVTNAVIDPGDYVCSTTPLRDWLQEQSAGLSEQDLSDASVIQSFNPITLDAVLYPEAAAGRFYGQDGEYTTRIQRTFRGLQGFWDIKSSDIELVPMHGSTLLDTARTTRVLALLFGDSAGPIAEVMAQIADQDKFDHGNWPGFTFNAFAFTLKGEEFPGVGAVSDKILIGDGVLDGARAIGLDDVAPNAILAHEFGHHIQYEDGLDASTLTGPEASRRLELMADTFGAYYLTHLRGAHVGIARVRDFVRLFYDLGDCSFTAAAHHGTPAQRRKAAEFGALNALLPLTKVLPSRTVGARFEKVLPKIVAPDAPPITPADLA
jgi:hypothetical protein